ncbi:MAG: cyclic pyranopterin monophosphate synthase MoaC [Eubacteriales bacterium]|nr:cyclic pyranopterin monophosphate synthase MoaC [Eubacteriales bacterium]
MENKLSHLDERGNARMVDVSQKAVTRRTAAASGCIRMRPETLSLIEAGGFAKGDVLATARIAGIMAVKQTASLIPLCHPLLITQCAVELAPDNALPGVRVRCTVRVDGKTGVEMEALTGASVALLTVYDMCKAADRAMEIVSVRLEEKEGGKSGHFLREEAL